MFNNLVRDSITMITCHLCPSVLFMLHTYTDIQLSTIRMCDTDLWQWDYNVITAHVYIQPLSQIPTPKKEGRWAWLNLQTGNCIHMHMGLLTWKASFLVGAVSLSKTPWLSSVAFISQVKDKHCRQVVCGCALSPLTKLNTLSFSKGRGLFLYVCTSMLSGNETFS